MFLWLSPATHGQRMWHVTDGYASPQSWSCVRSEWAYTSQHLRISGCSNPPSILNCKCSVHLVAAQGMNRKAWHMEWLSDVCETAWWFLLWCFMWAAVNILGIVFSHDPSVWRNETYISRRCILILSPKSWYNTEMILTATNAHAHGHLDGPGSGKKFQ